MSVCVCAKTWSPSGLHWHHTARLAPTTTAHTRLHTPTHSYLPAWLVWGMLLFWKDLWWQTEGNETQRDIYYQCQSLLSQEGKWGQQEILAENWVLSHIWKEEKKKKKKKQSLFCVTRVLKISNSEVSVEASNISKEGINKQFKENAWSSDYFASAFCPWCTV